MLYLIVVWETIERNWKHALNTFPERSTVCRKQNCKTACMMLSLISIPKRLQPQYIYCNVSKTLYSTPWKCPKRHLWWENNVKVGHALFERCLYPRHFGENYFKLLAPGATPKCKTILLHRLYSFASLP